MESRKTYVPPVQNPPIIGIGVSVEKLDAFKYFIKSIPKDSGMTFIIVQHLGFSHSSISPALLSRIAKIPVNEILDTIHFLPDHIYIIPFDKTLVTVDGSLKLVPLGKLRTDHVVDAFFKSIAKVYQNSVTGIVFAGAEKDGLQGLKIIKEHGGTTFIQDKLLSYEGIPQADMDTEAIDFILPSEKIAEKLWQIAGNHKVTQTNKELLTEPEDDLFKQVVSVLRQYGNIDFTYNQPTIRKHITRRMGLNKMHKLGDYIKMLRKDDTESHALFQDIFVSTAPFFRDPKVFHDLTKKVFPTLFKVEKELARAREDMCSIAEEQEATNGKLIAANEELLNNNEELRSLNEQLEISRAELQASYKKLVIRNQELLNRHNQLNTSCAYCEAIVNSAPEPLVIFDENFIIKTVNTSFSKKFNLTRQETIGKNIYEIKDKLFDTPALRAILGKEQLNDYELKINLPPLGEFNLLLNANEIIHDKVAEPLTLLSIADVTASRIKERKIEESEEKFRTLIESLPVMMWTTNSEGKWDFFNNCLLKYTGFTREDLMETGWQKYILPADYQKTLRLWGQSLKTGGDFKLEKRIRHFSGVYKWNLSQVIALRDKKGNVTQWLCIHTEIEEQKRITKELKTKIKETTNFLEQSNLQLEQFAHAASHEFQEPLRKIVTYSKILQNEHKPEDVKDYLKKIEKSSLRMTSLIQDMLNFATVTSHVTLFENTNLNKVLQNILNDFELVITEKKGQITIDKLPEIEAVPFQMNQLFYDLINNALKFCKQDVPPQIHITAHKVPRTALKIHRELNEKLQYYEVIIKDNGIGFHQKYAQQIFSMFQRLDISGKYAGTGIGLAICKKIVENYHGKIFAFGEENKGSSFHVILPVEQPKPELVKTHLISEN